jgi:hypothetical protein
MSWRHYERRSTLLLIYIPKLIHNKKKKIKHFIPTRKNNFFKPQRFQSVRCFGVVMKFYCISVVLEVIGGCFWGSLWRRRYLCDALESEVGGRVRSAADRSLENRLHSVIRWWAVCTVSSGQLQAGEGVFFILWRYDWKLPWLVRNCVRMNLGQRETHNFDLLNSSSYLMHQHVSYPTKEARSYDHCCSRKAISITYAEYVFVAIGIHSMQCACAILSSVACQALQCFSILPHKRHDFLNKNK